MKKLLLLLMLFYSCGYAMCPLFVVSMACAQEESGEDDPVRDLIACLGRRIQRGAMATWQTVSALDFDIPDDTDDIFDYDVHGPAFVLQTICMRE